MKMPLVLVINLARSPDRLDAMRGRLEQAGLQWQRVEALDGRQLGLLPWEGFDEFAYRYLWGKQPHANEFGCYLSHRRALSVFLGTGEEYALILEDDAALADDIVDVLTELVARADQWDVVKLESRHWGMPVTMCPMRKGRRLVTFTQRTAGAAGYLVNRKAAEAYVRRLLPMKVPYDHAFDQAWRFGFRMRGVLPRPIWSAGGASEIGYGGAEGAPSVFRRTVAPVYRGQIEVARVAHYLFRDPVWLAWLANAASGRRALAASGEAD